MHHQVLSNVIVQILFSQCFDNHEFLSIILLVVGDLVGVVIIPSTYIILGVLPKLISCMSHSVIL